VEEDRGIVGRRSSEQSQRGVSRRPVSLHATTTGLVGRQPAAAVAKSSAVRSAMGTAASGVNSSDSIRPGRSGYPKSSGRIIWVLKNSGIENCYLIRDKKKYYPQFRVPVISGSGSGITRFTRNI
jgi:hypothetical protein